MSQYEIHSCEQMMELIQHVGFLPLLVSGIPGYSAEDMADEYCRYTVLPEGGWEWPLWKWKGTIISESECVYGKFFNGKAGFISRRWWADFCNYRRSVYPLPQENSIEDGIYQTIREQVSVVNRDLRAWCGFAGAKMRSRFDGYVARLQMATRVVTEDFVYPHDKHGKEYGWGWSLLTTPEQLYGKEACVADCSPEESLARMTEHLHAVLPQATDKQITKLLCGGKK
ncbi:MAG: hypothetical protein E7073_04325 [Bacteroidales bacterium]|nr:hypothetical protein [Bacteroidales bacterium]MCM8872250.1 hypothetical protein [Paludibacteraceae bacterium]